MADEKSLKNIQRGFSLYGLTITKNLSAQVHKFLQRQEPLERESWLTNIMEKVLQQNPGSPHVTAEDLQQAIALCVKPDTALQDTETVFNVIDTFRVPKVVYEESKKRFVLKKVDPDLYPEAEHKSTVFRHRLELLWHRTLRQELYTPLKLGEPVSERRQLTPIEYLLSESKTGNVFVMGLLSQLTEGQYYLEDTGGSVKVDLKKAAGFITEGCIVIVNGSYREGVLNAMNIDFPPVEPSENTRALFNNENTFGGGHPTSLKTSENLKAYEEINPNAMIIFVSEFWVDNTRVLDKFEAMLDGFSESVPVAFVLCGHFLSFPPNMTSAQKLKEGFTRLAEIIQRYPDIKKNSKFVFVPGPHDLGAPKILPRGPLPGSLVEEFVKRVPGAIFASNPCRIQYCTKEIVVFREDMLTKLCRNALRFPKEGHVYEHYAKSIVCQSHLAPLSLPVIPVYWKHDHGLQLFPTPDLIVVADNFEGYTTSYEDCQVVNPGTFAKKDFPFKVYVPSIDTVEDSAIQSTEDDT